MLVFLDIDGTVVNYEGQMPLSAYRAIKLARDKGHIIYACTGCSTIEVKEKNLNLEIDGMIGGNGCYIESNGKILFHKMLSREQCIHFIKWCEKKGLAYRLECNSGMFISNDYEEKSYQARCRYITGEENMNIVPPMNPAMRKGMMIRDDVNKTAFVLNSYQDYLEAVQEFPDMEVGTWGGKGELPLYGDTSPKGISKEKACIFVRNYLQIAKKDTIAFGDSKGDIGMFRACGYGVAMGNGSGEIKKEADYVADTVYNDGLMKAFIELNII